MQNRTIGSLMAVAVIALGLLSCQSEEEKAAQARKEAREAYVAKLASEQSEKEKAIQEQIRQYVEDTPDLYRISWKICGDWNAPYNGGIRCNETKTPRTRGYFEPAYVWGASGVEFVNKQNFVDNFWTTGLFIKSQGCLNSGKPKQYGLYHVKDYMRKKEAVPPSPTDVKIERLSTENYTLTNFGVSATTGLIPTGKNCLILEEWKQRQP
jgi:hypothetical protein